MKTLNRIQWAFLGFVAVYFALQIFSCGRPPVGDALYPPHLSSPTPAAINKPGVAGVESPDTLPNTRAPGDLIVFFGLAPGVYHQSCNGQRAWWGDVPAHIRSPRTWPRPWWIVTMINDEGIAHVDTAYGHYPGPRMTGVLRMRPMTGTTHPATGRYELRRSW